MMKKILLSVCLVMFGYAAVNAQELSFRLGLGYAFPTAGQSLDASGLPYNGNVTYVSPSASNSLVIESASAKKASFGRGLKVAGGLQYMFTKNIGVAADINIGVTSQKQTLQTTNDANVNGNEMSDNTYTRYAKLPVLLLPSFVLASGGAEVNVYARAGLVLPLSAQIISEEHDRYQNVAGDEEQLNKNIKTQFNLGFAGAAGVSYRTSENFSLWVEANLVSLSLYPKEADVTTHTINGATTQAPPLPSTKISYISSGKPGGNEAMAFSVPFSYVGFMVGGSYHLGKRKTARRQE